MKKIYILIAGLLLTFGLQAQVVKNIENTAGQLKSLLSAEELNTITDLTVTGTMDARDFFTIRFSMPAITRLDISQVMVAAHSGTEPSGVFTDYAANTIPNRALQMKSKISALLLPSSITAIDIGAFWGCSSLTSVIIPPSVTRIGDASFKDCSLLTTVTMPSALTTIGTQAFDGCTSLTAITLPSTLTSIGKSAFNKCSAITEIVIPSSVTVIEEGTFYECSSLTSVSIPSTVTAIGEYAFFRCTSLSSIDLPPGIKSIEAYCLSSCTALTTLTLPSSVQSIGLQALSDCTSLTSITIPSSVTTIGIAAFKSCTALTDITLPAALTVVEREVFTNCSSLTSVTIPASVTSIGNSAFKWCNKLASVIIPSSVSAIGNEAFNFCPNIKDIWTYRSEPAPLSGYTFSSVDKSTCTLHVSYGSEASYAAAIEWKDFIIVADIAGFSISSNSLRFGVEGGEFPITIHSTSTWQASSDQPWLTISPSSGDTNGTVTVSAEANSTSTFRFAHITFTAGQGNPQIISVTQKSYPAVIPVTAGSLQYALTSEEMDTITSLTLTGTINANDIKLFNDGFPLLTKLDLSGTTISETQLDGIISKANWWPGPTLTRNSGNIGGLTKPSLTSIKLPSTLQVIGYGGFYECSGLTDIAIPSTVTDIGESAFDGCSSLTSITIPSSVTFIGPWAFGNCTGLTEFTLPSNMTSIGRSIFVNCTGFTTLTIPEGIKYIDFEAFRGCSGITTLTLPESVVSIDDMAFAYCPNITAIYSYNPVPPKLHSVFDKSIYSTCTLYVPAGSKDAYAQAEEWKEFTHIVAMSGFELSATELSVEAAATVQSIKITTLEAWSAVSDRDWLTISPLSGDSTQTVTFTSQENTTSESRTAIVTFSDGKGTSQTVTVTQKGSINSIPVANAGADQSVEEGTLVQLDGSASTDADSNPLTYLWTAPDGITLSSVSDARPTFTAPIIERDTTLTFNLVVNDGKENSAADKVLISITNKTIELGVSIDSVVFESKESSARVLITGNARWTALSDQEWLTVNPASGEGPKDITLTASENKTTTERIAKVTLSAPEAGNKTITITQHGLVTGADQMTSPMAIACYPNPFTQYLTIEVVNPSLKEVSVDVFSISGQKIKTLEKGQKGAKTHYVWNGRDDNERKMPNGMYLLKVNGETRKVMLKK